jgi:hypothetical protein
MARGGERTPSIPRLAFGPINPPDLQTRLHWVEEELRCGADEWWEHAEEEAFWKAALVEDPESGAGVLSSAPCAALARSLPSYHPTTP